MNWRMLIKNSQAKNNKNTMNINQTTLNWGAIAIEQLQYKFENGKLQF